MVMRRRRRGRALVMMLMVMMVMMLMLLMMMIITLSSSILLSLYLSIRFERNKQFYQLTFFHAGNQTYDGLRGVLSSGLLFSSGLLLTDLCP
jgi:hypothetical protein